MILKSESVHGFSDYSKSLSKGEVSNLKFSQSLLEKQNTGFLIIRLSKYWETSQIISQNHTF